MGFKRGGAIKHGHKHHKVKKHEYGGAVAMDDDEAKREFHKNIAPKNKRTMPHGPKPHGGKYASGGAVMRKGGAVCDASKSKDVADHSKERAGNFKRGGAVGHLSKTDNMEVGARGAAGRMAKAVSYGKGSVQVKAHLRNNPALKKVRSIAKP
jgi:hypothetical protein